MSSPINEERVCSHKDCENKTMTVDERKSLYYQELGYGDSVPICFIPYCFQHRHSCARLGCDKTTSSVVHENNIEFIDNLCADHKEPMQRISGMW